jgi:thymidylate synthase (FAD)
MALYAQPEDLLGLYAERVPGVGAVELVAVNGDARLIVNAARASLGAYKKELGAADYGLLRFLAKNRHETPFRQVTFALRIALPLHSAFQLRKHKVGINWSPTVFPPRDGPLAHARPRFRAAPANRKQGSAGPVDAATQEAAAAAHAAACGRLFAEYRATGDRAVFPMDGIVVLECCASLQAVEHLIQLRTAGDAQGEVREIAMAIKRLFDESIGRELAENGVDLAAFGYNSPWTEAVLAAAAAAPDS